MSATIEAAALRRRPRAATRMASTATAETHERAASSANAAPTPTELDQQAAERPGPSMRSAIGRTNWSSELACGELGSGSTSGTIASKAGPKKAAPAP